MSEINMPVAEAKQDVVHDEHATYELAFHVLPTVAEGEVTRVFEDIKTLINKSGGEVSIFEAPQRFELAYEIVKSIEGKYRSFKSAYFGWVRFSLPSTHISKLTEEIEHNRDILRHLIIRLSKTEEATPFYFHEALATKVITTIDVDEALAAEDADEEEAGVDKDSDEVSDSKESSSKEDAKS